MGTTPNSSPDPLGTGKNLPKIDKGTNVAGASPVPGPANASTTITNKTGAGCQCTGDEVTTLTGLGEITSYKGEFPSPLQVMWYVPDNEHVFNVKISDTEIRQWIKNAAAYQKIPHILLAIILQQENGPRATTTQKVLQFGERSLTTFAAILDKHLWDIVPDKVAGSSTGFANMSRNALLGGVTYSETTYCRPPLPDSVRYRILGWDQDTRVSGDDWQADLYYCAAHLRQLIDRVTNTQCHHGNLDLAQLEQVIAAYNGSGPLAEKYAKDAIKTLQDAAAGKADLYFYET
jgi:hypothetical protein